MVTVIVILRPPLWQRLLPPLCLALVATALLGLGVRAGGLLLVAVVPVGVLTLLLAARSWALRVEAHPAKLVLVNWLFSVHLPWAELARCGHDDDGVWIWREDGHEFRPAAFRHAGPAPSFVRRPAEAAAARLESLRAAHR